LDFTEKGAIICAFDDAIRVIDKSSVVLEEFYGHI